LIASTGSTASMTSRGTDAASPITGSECSEPIARGARGLALKSRPQEEPDASRHPNLQRAADPRSQGRL
jgi:hypothetical protein